MPQLFPVSPQDLPRLFHTDQRLWIPDREVYTYPDVMVTPRPPELKPDRNDTVMNPILISALNN